jgi:hypothetical protein
MVREDLIAFLREHAPPGEQVGSNGTVRLGPVPQVAPLAFLHTVHAPLTADEIAQLQQELPVRIPEPYREFLRTANGLRLFVSTVAFFGLRALAPRDLSGHDWPYSLLTSNLHERPSHLEPGALVVGVHSDDGSPLVMNQSSAGVVCLAPGGRTVRETWPNIDTMIEGEVARLTSLLAPTYDGIRINSPVRKLPGAPLPTDSVRKPASPWWRFW